ncbi:phage head closure protein [Lacticaseibacillus nasuensis]|uniref:phage head closure protein n=1 Tax=Lacticaseibacillus nasuensis TaxID=944671 RepID=UPI00396A93E7
MVRLATPQRLTLKIKLGTQTTVPNAVGVPVPAFKAVAETHAGAWSRTALQSYAVAGTDLEHTDIYVVRHRKDYEGITRVLIGTDSYQLVDVQSDPIGGPTAYDLLTVKKVVTKHG